MTALTPDAGEVVHAVSFYASEREWLDVCVSFCEAGLGNDEPIFAILTPPHAELLQAALDEPSRVVFLSREARYANPPEALRTLRDQCAEHLLGAAPPIRLVGEPPAPSGLACDSWLRYEAAINHVVGGRSMRGLCLYPQQALSTGVQTELRRAHPVIVTPDGGHHPNADYRPPAAFTAHRVLTVSDPLEQHPAAIQLTDPHVATARHLVSDLAQFVDLEASDVDDLVLAVSEVVTNAIVHGRPPVCMRGWGVPRRVVLTVTDAGPGPDDPLAGLRLGASDAEHGGFGLWVAHQLCPELAMGATRDGFTVRLAAGFVDPGGPPAQG